MKIIKSLATSALLLGTLVAGAAQAGELTLFARPDFGGARLTVRGHTPNVSAYDFNDRASSLVVHSGRWEICTDADFSGHCARFGPGRYAVLDPAFNNRISSARELGARGRPIGERPNAARGIVKFFSRPSFGGRSLDLQEDTADLSERRYNDRVASLIVSEGVWELCSDEGFSGHCRRYGPGRYPSLDPELEHRISSARVVRHRDGPLPPPPPPVRGDSGYRPIPPGHDVGPSKMALYYEDRLQGPGVVVTDTVPNFQSIGFNDATASAMIEGGPWLVCTDADFRGHCRVLQPGQYDDLRAFGLYKGISSARRAGPGESRRGN